ncbi:stage III sporulation protein AA [Caminicella sporogenes]|uniref:stage III sporulation protein AA n=1 Tax=Caminicella sporogenes TaxID=166485 RepID=UPI0025404A09|nr:stage III sporulation protein AA [Caminicella sporogenes]WIF94530.1 stage III sporulation protein AA [Caminicella sporogenes]
MEKHKEKNNSFIGIKHMEKKIEELNFNEVLSILPVRLRKILMKISSNTIKNVEEIRLRVNRPLIINVSGEDYFVTDTGIITKNKHNIIMVNKLDVETCFQLVTDYSAYALEEEIRNGFITIKGGHRVGICGKTIIEKKRVKTLKDISGLNIRFSKEKIGCAKKVIRYIIKSQNSIYNTLIISPPQCGKTTLLRDIVRLISNGVADLNFKGINVGVVDERSEIGGCYNGVPQNDIGIRTDILDSCPKAEGMIMLIRSMSPKVIVTDEIGRDDDIYALKEAMNAGVKFITTIHGSSLEEVCRRENISKLIKNKVFERVIILSNKPKVGTVRKIIDCKNNKILNDVLLYDRSETDYD